jgi:pimeloyl-ACP methyl ester carboxylesterase
MLYKAVKFESLEQSGPFGKLFWREGGAGEQLLVFSGGPGLSHSYLFHHLSFLARGYRVTFFDQLGCGGSVSHASPTTEETVSHAVEAIRTLSPSKPVVIVAHSWGAFVAFEVLSRAREISVRKVVLLNPVPMTKAGYDASGAALASRVPHEVLQEIAALMAHATPDAGMQVMMKALPYYCGRTTSLPSLEFDYCIPTYNSVAASLPAYSHVDLFRGLMEKTTVVFGRTDFITEDMYSRDVGKALPGSMIQTLEGGHFAFADDEFGFQKLFPEVL